jgi:hypothetical protein
MSQLNFLLTEHEFKEKLRIVHQTGDYMIFAGRSFKSGRPIAIQNFDGPFVDDDFTIWVKNDFVEPVCSSRGTGDFAECYLFDYYHDPMIELDGCKYSNGLISPGRLFYKAGWIKHPELRLIHKRMASKLLRIFSKGLTNFSSHVKISAGVEKQIQDGFRIEVGLG